MKTCDLLVLVFSYNRAMQLDFTLRSMFHYFHSDSYRVVVLYHSSENHAESYSRLIDKYRFDPRVSFVLRRKGSFFRETLPYLFSIRNLYRFLKYSHLRNTGCEFKSVVQRILMESLCEFVMFSTDDTVFYKDQEFGDNEKELLRASPAQRSLRFFVGSNVVGCPSELSLSNGFIKWDYVGGQTSGNWAYPFAVDATIYSTSGLLNIIQPLLYNSPSTFEGYVCRQMIVAKMFREGYSPMYSSVVGLPLNKVQCIVENKHGGYDVAYLNEMFLQGYELDVPIPSTVNCNAYVPTSIVLEKDGERLEVLSK